MINTGWKAVEFLFGLYVRRLDRAGGRARTGTGRQGLFRLHGRRAEATRQIYPRQHDRALRAGALGAGRAGPRSRHRSRLRGAAALGKAQVGCRHALSKGQPIALGQAGRRGRSAGDAAGDAGSFIVADKSLAIGNPVMATMSAWPFRVSRFSAPIKRSYVRPFWSRLASRDTIQAKEPIPAIPNRTHTPSNMPPFIVSLLQEAIG